MSVPPRLTRERIETLISVLNEHEAFQRSDEGIGWTMTQDQIAKETRALLAEVDRVLAERDEQLRDWRTWAQFVYLKGGPITMLDGDLRLSVCQAHDAEIETVRQETRALREALAQTWQPISTAPKDGTYVLLWWQSEIGRGLVSWWACGQWCEFGDGSKGWHGDSFHCSEPGSWTRLLGERPTHWMPLPASPGAQKET